MLPDIGSGIYIINWLHEAGLLTATGMGVAPLSWQEIEAWASVTETQTELWERLMIKELSEVYVRELNVASAKDAPSPYTFVDEFAIDREVVSSKLLNFLRSFNKRAPVAEDVSETGSNGSIPPTG